MMRLEVRKNPTPFYPENWGVVSPLPLVDFAGTFHGPTTDSPFAGKWVYNFGSRTRAFSAVDWLRQKYPEHKEMTADLDDAHSLVHVEPS